MSIFRTKSLTYLVISNCISDVILLAFYICYARTCYLTFTQVLKALSFFFSDFSMSKFNQPKTVKMDVNEQNAKSLESGVFYFFYIYIHIYVY